MSSAPSAARCARRFARSCDEQRRGSPRRHDGHVAARRAPRDDDAVARRDRRHVGADLLDDAGALVAEQDREAASPSRPSRRRARRCGRGRTPRRAPAPRAARARRASISSTAGAAPGLGVDDAARHDDGAAQLLVERDERQLEDLDRARIGDDVVAELEHRQLVARHRRARQPLGQRRLRAHAARPARGPTGAATPSTRFSRSQKLVPRRRLRAAELERAPEARRVLDRVREVLRRRPRPRSAATAASRRRRSASPARSARAARTSAARRRRRRRRSSAGRRRTRGSTTATARSISHFAVKYGTASFERSSRPSALVSTKRPTPGILGGRDEVARAVLHHALEVGARALDDRDEMDHRVDADARGAQRPSGR